VNGYPRGNEGDFFGVWSLDTWRWDEYGSSTSMYEKRKFRADSNVILDAE